MIRRPSFLSALASPRAVRPGVSHSGEPAGTDGRRIYAIGDIHGCLSELQGMHARIAADLKVHPHPRPLIVHLGDYVDRGPDSRGVIEALLTPALPEIETVSLRGNHDDLMLRFLDQPHGLWCRFHWLEHGLGGSQTLASYGVRDKDPARAADQARACIPASHIAFLHERPRLHRVGSYLFVHAGIKPGVPLDEQDPEDLIWIRREFLDSRADHGLIVVHGHTPVDEVELRPNRIGIDTGLVFGGTLTCLVLEKNGLWTLEAGGRLGLVLP